jgi:phosphate starvation-inducible PhoH-like protein
MLLKPTFFICIMIRSFSIKKRSPICNKNMFPVYQPRSDNQKKYVEYINDPKIDIVFGTGPAGTGKTLFACIKAIDELKQGNIDKIILTRPVVTVEEEIGFLPGNMATKMDPWIRPIIDIFSEYYSKTDIDAMIRSETIEISPLGFMRGRTFKRSFIIADEMQNSSPNQMFMLTTRIGMRTKMIVTGDLNQSDKGQQNGLYDILTKIKRANSFGVDDIRLVEFKEADIERSPIVRTIMGLYFPLTCDSCINSLPFSLNNTKTLPLHNTKKINKIVSNDDCAMIPN